MRMARQKTIGVIVALFMALGLGTSAVAESKKPATGAPAELGLPALEKSSAPGRPGSADLKSRVSELEEGLARLEAEVAILKTQSTMVIQRTQLSYANATYMMVGMSLLLPRSPTFKVGTDSGIGAVAGIGRYFGSHHVVELTAAWDFYLAADLQYRYEFHTGVSRLSWGPVVGYRTKLFRLSPFDRFVTDANQVRHTFYYFGALLGFPVGGASLLRFEMLYLTNVQQVITASLGAHFFL